MDAGDILILLVFLSFLIIANARRIDLLLEYIALLRPLRPSYVEAIEKYNTFFQKLSEKKKVEFLKKVKQFIYTKEFIPRHIPEVTDEMIALISSSAIQLTFGLPNITLKHFKRILVYPDEYYSVINRQYHMGEVNPRFKSIVVSWRAFVEGYADPHDGINLGLHEMAHALKLENIIRNGEHHFFSRSDYKQWLDLAGAEITRIRNGEESLFRDYAGTNEDEFFATGMELYFETPDKLYNYNPDLYKTLSNLLNQDIIRLIG